MEKTPLEGRIGNNIWTIYPYDCVEALNKIGNNTINCIVTSPPYKGLRAYGEKGKNVGNNAEYSIQNKGNPINSEIGFGQSNDEYFDSLEKVFGQCYRVLKDKTCFFINVGKIRNKLSTYDLSHEIIKRALNQGFIHRDTIIWIKANPWPNTKEAKPYYLDDGWEYLLLFTKGKAIINRDTYVPFTNKFKCTTCNEVSIITKKTQPNYFQTHIGYTEKMLKSKHPAKFPLSLPNFAFNICTNQGDTILDPFAGVGTTLVAGLMNRLNVIGCEINLEYCQLAKQEMENFKKKENSIFGVTDGMM